MLLWLRVLGLHAGMAEQGERERSLLHLLYGVKTCLWKGILNELWKKRVHNEPCQTGLLPNPVLTSIQAVGADCMEHFLQPQGPMGHCSLFPEPAWRERRLSSQRPLKRKEKEA